MINPFRNFGKKPINLISPLKSDKKPDHPIEESLVDMHPIEIERINDEDKQKETKSSLIGEKSPTTPQPQADTKPTIISR